MRAPLLHATTVTFCGKGLLLRGPSGSGKSELALRLMDAGGTLVADDYTCVTPNGALLVATPPQNIEGLIEARGIGLLRVPFQPSTALDLVIDCVPRAGEERLPEPASTELDDKQLAGYRLPLLRLYPFDAAIVAKLRAYLQQSRL